jgi:hypothetical protein
MNKDKTNQAYGCITVEDPVLDMTFSLPTDKDGNFLDEASQIIVDQATRHWDQVLPERDISPELD